MTCELGPTIQELFDLTGRVAVVTGGSSGLGLDGACALADLGARVIVTSRDAEKAAAAATRLSSRSKEPVLGWKLDVTEEESVQQLFGRVESEFGRLDVLVNNAGGANPSQQVSILDRRLEDWEEVLRTNLTGAFLCSRSAVSRMIKQKSGSIINISSIAGVLGRDTRMYDVPEMGANMVDYAASKAGLLGLTRESAAWLGPHGIRVNAILPGGFERGQPEEFIRRYADATPLRRMGRDRYDLKGAIALLASDAGAYISGESLFVDGGFSIYK